MVQHELLRCAGLRYLGKWRSGIVNDPGINNWNSTFAKTFRIREGHSLEFRLETYNTFNHTQWLGANYTRSNANFGRITGARPARQIQGAIFYRF